MPRLNWILMTLPLFLLSCSTPRSTSATVATGVPGDVVDTSSKPFEESATVHAVRVDEMATDELIRMSRSGCGWACPSYTLSFFRDGTIVFHGRSHTAVSGEQRSRLSDAALADLLRELQQQLPGLAKRYTPDSKDCGPMFTDQATTKLSARLRQGLVTAERYGGCPAAPKTLAALEKKVDAVAGSDLWVSNRPAY